MKNRRYRVLALCCWAVFCGRTEPVLVEAESFQERGGWVVDQQFMDVMGSPFLLAHGLGQPVPPARAAVELPAPGAYRIFVRTRDWVAPYGPGTFRVAVDGNTLPVTFGVGGAGEWAWQDGGSVTVTGAVAVVELIDQSGFEGRCDALLFVPAHEADGYVPPDTVDFAWRRNLLGLPQEPPPAGEYDLVVVGGGYAGICAAVSAARLGVKTALIQNRPVLGGNASSEIRVCPIGGVGMAPFPRNSDILYEIHKLSKAEAPKDAYVRSVPDERALEEWMRAEENVALFLNRHVCEVVTDGGRIVSVTARHIETSKELSFGGRFFADCTGDGTVGFLAGAEFRAGSESREETGESFAPSGGKRRYLGATNYWKTRWTKKDEPFPECPWALDITGESLHVSSLGFDPNAVTKDPYVVYWNWESGFYRDQILEAEHIRDHNFRAMYGAWDFMKNKSRDKARYRKAELYWAAYVTGKRESRRLMGDHVLTQDDLTRHRLYEDGCVTTTWYLDIHYPHPENSRHFPGQEFRAMALDDPDVKTLRADAPNELVAIRPYPIPFRCFYSRNVENLFMAGRNISGTHVALASPRVMNTTAQMGTVVGRAASLCVKYDCSPRTLYADHLDDLKALLANPGEQTALSIAGEKMMQGRDTFVGELKWRIRRATGLPVRTVAAMASGMAAVVALVACVWFVRKKVA
jgi:hypothetical protein